MKDIIRTLKNSIWYFIIMCAGLDYYIYSPLKDWLWWVGFLVLPVLLWVMISKARKVVRF